MSDIREFEIGDWLVNEDGICQVLGSQKYVVESFFKNDYPTKKLGEVFENKVVCKILCNFEPKLRKSRFIKHYSSEWCKPLNSEYDVLKNQVKSEYPLEYEKFQSIELKKPVLANLDFSIRVLPNQKTITLQKLNDLLSIKIKSMVFNEVEELILNNIEGIESRRLINNDTLRTNVLISLVYEVLGAKDKKFRFISGKAVSVYCSDE